MPRNRGKFAAIIYHPTSPPSFGIPRSACPLGPFCTRTVVALDVDDSCIVVAARVFECLYHPADFIVGFRQLRCVDLHLVRKGLLLVGIELVLRSYAWIYAALRLIRPQGQLRLLGDDAQLFLTIEDLFTIRIPATVKLVLEVRDPLAVGRCRAWVAPGAS